ncbi:MAG: anhydro-N-acetylmuramic acid kinase [Gemmatimonadetes bacterium]|nr:anhydro-N-acetylmuramic acid kinase [Gemmatimonadota bacterium]NIR79758.1 anhydro-N-acetylmuramic acid kinase [Gemmatimonadota bacterium]NIT88454.1 anhydro-N-acetylmuramic acid kinase [Gemmatimonadota bacterium]NIU32277.1 anhydro-N-acetylmuramic acid kinase [Gemmatimonadota bacterium]NIU36818.1 anhydro-N-acetylmuramic acid kinase [Gemmatimonadota bacterium]
MSGTSLDGVDAALLEVAGATAAEARCRLLAFVTLPYAEERRERLLRAAEGRARTPEICRLHYDLGEWLAEAVKALLESAGPEGEAVAAIGSHGQTVWHEPPTSEAAGATLQIGSPAILAERTGIPVVSDLRARDVAAGGHGAPLVPLADRILFSAPDRRRALQNLGGIANVTLLPERGSDEALLALDTGPGVALLDAAARAATDGALRYDEEGELAAAGEVDDALLDRLLADPFFDEPPPRSTGRERFGAPLVERLADEMGLVPGRSGEGWPDLLATLVAFTARSVADAYGRWVVPRGVDEAFLTGGGARNPALAQAIRRELAPLPVHAAESLDVPADAREAAAFAVLAWAHLRGVAGNVPEATGARGGRVLGSFTPGSAGSEPGGPASAPGGP